jgi:hypothetical protein
VKARAAVVARARRRRNGIGEQSSVGSWSRRPAAWRRDEGRHLRARVRAFCHVPAERRPDSFELGGGKGNNGVSPGVSGFGPGQHGFGPGQHFLSFGRHWAEECPHPACVGEVAVRVRRRQGLGFLGVPANWGETSR